MVRSGEERAGERERRLGRRGTAAVAAAAGRDAARKAPSICTADGLRRTITPPHSVRDILTNVARGRAGGGWLARGSGGGGTERCGVAVAAEDAVSCCSNWIFALNIQRS